MKKIISILFVFTLLVGCSSTKGKDVVSNENWIARDGSYLMLKEDNSYVWAMDKEDLNDNLFIGDYTVLIGKAAVKYLSEDFLVGEDYNIEGLKESLQRKDKKYKKSHFIVLTLNRTGGVIDGVKSSDAYGTLYFGYIVEDQTGLMLDLVNFSTMNYASFVLDK